MTKPPVLRRSAKSPLAPDAGKAGEIGAPVTLARLVTPESQWHRGKRRRADKFSFFSVRRALALLRPDVDRKPEPRPLDFAAIDRRCRVAGHETGHDVGAPGNRRQIQVLLYRAVDIVETVCQQRRPGRYHRAEPGQVMLLFQTETCLAEAVDVSCRRPKNGSCVPHWRSRTTPRVPVERASRRKAAGWRLGPNPRRSQFHIIQPSVVK